MNDMPNSFLQGFRETHGATLGHLAGMPAALDFGAVEAETESLRQRFGLVEREASGVILVRGGDAAAFLNGLTTNDVQQLSPGKAQPNLLCANKGKILHPVDVVRAKADQYLIVCQPGSLEEVAGYLEAYLIREDVELGRVGLVRLDLIGPGATPAVGALGHSISEGVGAFNEAPVLTLDYALGDLPRVMVLLPGPVAEAWAEAVLERAPEGRPVGNSALEEARIGARVPRFGVDYGTEHLPAEAGLHDRMSFDKGCYVGQEIHARLHYRGHVNRKLVALDLPAAMVSAAGAEGEACQPGALLHQSGQQVGTLTSIGRIPLSGRMRGIAMVRHEAIQDGGDLSIAADGPPEIAMGLLAAELGGGRQ
ncbi:MAG: hypothetical protein V3S64_02720 [bacterium]